MRSARTRLTRAQILSYGPFIGAEGDGAGAAGGTGAPANGDGGSGTGGTSGDVPDDKTGSAGGSSKSDSLDDITDVDELRRKAKNSTEAGDRLARKLKEAEKQRDDLAKVQEEQERKGKTELENAKADLEKSTADNATLLKTVRELTIANTFLGLKDIDWHDPEDALRLVDLTDVEWDEKDGKIKDKSKLVKAAKKLSTDKPHLVRSGTSAPPGTPNPKGGKSGNAPGTKDAVQLDREKIKAKYGIHH